MEKYFRYYHTLRHLKWIQIRYQVWYRLRQYLGSSKEYDNVFQKGHLISWSTEIYTKDSLVKGSFNFLNREATFEKSIDWNFTNEGKLWTYNLNYFDFLHQENIDVNQGLKLMHDFSLNYKSLIDGKESYPTSLRIINWIKFFFQHSIQDSKFDEIIGKDTNRLRHNLEYHLLANHLLENAFALFFAAVYFHDRNLYDFAKKLLLEQLDEQILNDGAHYELSVMYHQLMIYRVLDCIQLVRKSNWVEDNIENQLLSKVELMLSWLDKMTFSNGDIPLFNDAAKGINPTSRELKNYAKHLNIKINDISLKESGYRKLSSNIIECFFDVGDLQPSYQPGHSHADTFTFICNINSEPFIVDVGTSTYEKNNRREYERSTRAHNTIEINGTNSSDVWSGFRVGKRAKVKVIEENESSVIASHDGYKPIIHNRKWVINNNTIEINDDLSHPIIGVAYIHFHPDVTILKKEKENIVTNRGSILFKGSSSISIDEFHYAETWNETHKAIVLIVTFKKNLSTIIQAA